MSCGCANSGAGGSSTNEQQPVVPSYQLPNETIECYMRRTAGDPVPPQAGSDPNRIATLKIPVDCAMKVDTTFAMTNGSQPVTWSFEMKDDEGNVVQPADFGLTYDNNTPRLSGTFSDTYEKQKIHAHMKALATVADNTLDPPLNVGDVVDEKEYLIVPKTCDPNDLRFVNPSPGAYKTSDFGEKRGDHVHKGIDLASGGKNDILAAADGTVVYAGVQNGYGNCVEIAHKDASGGVLASSFYGHLSQIYTKVGAQVGAGQKIGHEGNTGISFGSHLHFEIRLQGRKGSETDPWPLINGEVITDAQANTNVDPGQTSSGAPITSSQSNKGLSREAITAATDCPQQPVSAQPAAAASRSVVTNLQGCAGKCTLDCMPAGWTPPPKGDVAQQIVDTLNKRGVTNFQDQLYFVCVALVESNLCQYAQYCGNVNSDAAGLYQFLTSSGTGYYKKAGIAWSCENRASIEFSTIAFIEFFKEQEAAWNNYKGGSQSYTDTRLASLSREQFMYEVHGQGGGGVKHGTPNFQGFLNNYQKSSDLWNLPDIATVIAKIRSKPGG